MAAAVAATFTPTQLDDYGNIILNGYETTVPNTINKKAWQYKETTTAPVNLPSLQQVRPALKGWTTNYMEYYTQLPPNNYGVNPGDPTMFEYVVHSFTAQQGVVTALGLLQAGINYTPGSYTNVATIGGSGIGATLNIIVDADGTVSSATISNAGSGYTAGDGLGVASPGPIGSGILFSVAVATVSSVSPAGQSKWSQAPRRFFQNTVGVTGPNPSINYPNAIQYSFMYPVADSPLAPPIDVV